MWHNDNSADSFASGIKYLDFSDSENQIMPGNTNFKAQNRDYDHFYFPFI